MKELLEYLAKALVKNQSALKITETKQGNETIFEVKVASEDMGRIIGKGGKTAKAIRTLVCAVPHPESMRVTIKFTE